jgi:hypothetical protein
LTLLPLEWSKRFITYEVLTSDKLIRKARALQTQKGILSLPEKKKVKRVQDEVVENVIKFFYDDENSRCLPGMHDFVKVNGELKEKRLLLHNLKDLYKLFVKSFNSDNPSASKIGLSKFCLLRPKEIRLADSKGMHNVCVCTIHENVRFQTDVFTNDKHYYNTLIAEIVCSTEDPSCMLGDCNLCGHRKKESDPSSAL